MLIIEMSLNNFFQLPGILIVIFGELELYDCWGWGGNVDLKQELVLFATTNQDNFTVAYAFFFVP